MWEIVCGLWMNKQSERGQGWEKEKLLPQKFGKNAKKNMGKCSFPPALSHSNSIIESKLS